jgi:hypothetical protein
MAHPGLVVVGIIVAAIVLVALPVALTTYLDFRKARWVRCPETESKAAVHVDPLRAAIGSTVGALPLHVDTCSLWPERQGCAESCAAQFEELPG